jgi:aldose 1-epimerase
MKSDIYAAQWLQDHDSQIIALTDNERAIDVRVIPGAGNRAYRMAVRGENILHFPALDPGSIRDAKHLDGIPFLAPWANRIPGGMHANGHHYSFNMESSSIRLDPNGLPIHGLLTACPWWKVTALVADQNAASVTSRLEFWRYPELMTNWPFAHEYEMTYRLSHGVLEVRLAVINLSADPMPVAVGFHPYFELPGVPRSEAIARVPVRSHVDMDDRLVPTGKLTPVEFKNPVSLADHFFDYGFTDLIPNEPFSVEGGGKKIEVRFGPKYTVAIVYAPKGENYICFEPMTALTNGINLAYEGKYSGLQSLAPGARWEESFWITANI